MTQSLFILFCALLLLVPTSLAMSERSLIPDDAESGTDAPNDCVSDSPSRLNLIHEGTYGELIHADDPADVYTIAIKAGQKVDVVQSLPSDESGEALHAPHAPHMPYGSEALGDEVANPFGLEVRNVQCGLVERSDDPAVLPRTISLDTEGIYQVVLFEVDGTSLSSAQVAARDNEAVGAMCHPPCTMDGYIVEGITG